MPCDMETGPGHIVGPCGVMEFFGFYSRYDQKDLNRKRHDQSLCFNRPLQFTGSQPGAFLPLRRHLAVPEDVLLS